MSESTDRPTLRLVLKNDSFELGRLAEAFDDFADRHQVSDRRGSSSSSVSRRWS